MSNKPQANHFHSLPPIRDRHRDALTAVPISARR
jgi:hypothetical protein